MTNTEYRLKYPIGSRIIYAPNVNNVCSQASKDIGKQGTVIKHLSGSGSQVIIHLPESEKHSKTWRTLWENIIPAIKKNEQLLFSFMQQS